MKQLKKKYTKVPNLILIVLVLIAFLLWILFPTKPAPDLLPQVDESESKIFKECMEKGETRDFDSYFKFGNSGRYKHHSYLKNNGVIVEIGGFTGEDTQTFLEQYPDVTMHVFEPHPTYFSSLVERFKGNPKVISYPFGLDEASKIAFLVDSSDGSSAYSGTGQKIPIFLREAVQELKSIVSQHKKSIDLLNINCEGCEYGLLEQILEQNSAHLIENIQVQFHPIESIDSTPRYCRIQSLLSKTHKKTFYYHYVWENWKRSAK
jgi:FkbM family methyltransferase